MAGGAAGEGPAARRPPRRAPALAAALALLAATAAAYRGVLSLGFVFDDSAYIVENRGLRLGLGWAGVRWAFTTELMGNRTPLALLSHLADFELFGLRPAGHHATSLLLHLLAAALLFAALRRATGALWRSALAAAVFALHPLHVESVAWVAERKDVLSGALWMAAIVAHLRHCARPGPTRYALLVAAAALCLLAKPMTVTLPLVLLLLDWWPLGRWRGPGAARRLLLEKAPLLALSAAAGVVTLAAQRRAGTVHTLATLDLAARAENAIVALGTYLAKSVWPHPLAAYYPLPTGGHPGWKVAAAALLVVAATAFAVRQRARRPFLLAGWAWFLVMLLPVIGILHVGMQAMADRYTYLPLVGLAVAASWGAGAAAARRPRAARAITAATLAALAALGARTALQVPIWRDDLTLFTRVAAVTPGHWIPHHFLGLVLARAGRLEEAAAEFRASGALAAGHAEPHVGLGDALRRLGRFGEAADAYARALAIDPGIAAARAGLAEARRRAGAQGGRAGAGSGSSGILPRTTIEGGSP